MMIIHISNDIPELDRLVANAKVPIPIMRDGQQIGMIERVYRDGNKIVAEEVMDPNYKCVPIPGSDTPIIVEKP